MPYMLFVLEAKPRDTKHTMGIFIFPIGTIQCRNYALCVFVPEAKPRDTKHTMVIISISRWLKILHYSVSLNYCIDPYIEIT